MKWIRTGIHVIAEFCIACMAAVFFVLGLSVLTGSQKYVVTSGSMEPTIPVGSCIFVKYKAPEEIQVDEIITYFLGESDTAVTHRVIGKDEDLRQFTTKGDANEVADARPVSYEAVDGVAWLILPMAGYLLIFLNDLHGKVAVICLLLVCMGVSVLTGNRKMETKTVR